MSHAERIIDTVPQPELTGLVANANLDPQALAQENLQLHDLSQGPATIDLTQATPLEQSEGVATLGVMEAAGVGLKVMGFTNPDGSLDHKSIFVQPADYVPQPDTSKFQRLSIVLINAGADPKVFGRNQSGAGRLGLNKPDVSRNHFSIGLTEDGILSISDAGSTNGTKLITALKQPEVAPITPEAAQVLRQKLLFAPLGTKSAQSEAVNYDYLFDPNYEPPEISQPIRALKKFEATETTRKQASERLSYAMARDEKLEEIVAHGKPAQSMTAIVDQIREDKDLRFKVGAYLQGKLNRDDIIIGMPERIVRNTGKAPTSNTYDELLSKVSKLSSREVTVLYALAMLDGTYVEDKNDILADYHPRTNPDGGGQHRYAAQKLLDASGEPHAQTR